MGGIGLRKLGGGASPRVYMQGVCAHTRVYMQCMFTHPHRVAGVGWVQGREYTMHKSPLQGCTASASAVCSKQAGHHHHRSSHQVIRFFQSLPTSNLTNQTNRGSENKSYVHSQTNIAYGLPCFWLACNCVWIQIQIQIQTIASKQPRTVSCKVLAGSGSGSGWYVSYMLQGCASGFGCMFHVVQHVQRICMAAGGGDHHDHHDYGLWGGQDCHWPWCQAI